MKKYLPLVICAIIALNSCKTKQSISEPAKEEAVTMLPQFTLLEAYLQKEIGGQENEPTVEYLFIRFKPFEDEGIIFSKMSSNGKEVKIQKSSESFKVDVTDLNIKTSNPETYPTIFYSKNNQNGSLKIEPILMKEPLYRP
jgi:hypothetical protein